MDKLIDRHYQQLSEDSGISDELIEARGYETVTEKSELARRGFGEKQRRVPGILIPLHSPKGGKANIWQLRPDRPRKNAKGKVLKYEFPWGKSPVLDTPPVELMRDALNTKREAIFITEGSKKADSAASRGVPCLSLAGVWNWRGVNSFGVKTTIADLDEIDWEGRTTYLCFDNDVVRKESVYWALVRLGGILDRRGADVQFTVLPEGDAKGLDDYFVQGGKVGDLYRMSTDKLPPPVTTYYTLNDVGMANRVSDAYDNEIVFDNHNDVWYVWDESRWRKDKQGNFVRRYVVEYTQVVREEANGLSGTKEDGERKSPRDNHLSHALAYGNAGPVRGAADMMKAMLTEHEPGFDQKPNLLNCPNGTLDLRTMEFNKHRPDDRITVMTGVDWPEDDSEYECPMWHAFMEERFHNLQTREFVQRMCGLFVTGNSPEKAFFIIQGETGCGKTVFIEYLHWLLGEYANKVDKATLTKTKGQEGKQLERAVELVGKRYVYVDESDKKDEIDAAFIKEITGGDTTLKFRRLYEQANQTKAEFTLLLATNYRPRITGDDAAIWRRCHLIEFGQPLPEDKMIGNFREMLEAEGPGVLAWCVAGYRSWTQCGLETPEEVIGWTKAYQEDNDPLGKFINECYEVGEEVSGYMTPKALATHFEAWCGDNDIMIKTLKDAGQFSKALRSRWPIVNESKRSGAGRKLAHMRPISEFRSTEGLERMIDE